MKFLGIDYSAKKIGLALGDGETRVAVPLEVLPGGDDGVARIIALAKREYVDAFVVGVPVPFKEVHHDKQYDRVRQFIRDLKSRSELPVHEIDEVMTTREARRIQDEYKSGVAEDALAAMLILEDFFNSLP